MIIKKILRWRKKLKTFKDYRVKLRHYLKEKYGRTNNLEYNQMRNALSKLNLNGEYEEYAYAMSLSKSQYKYYQNISGVIYSQDALQIELGVSTLLRKELSNYNYHG